jgi:hypothetical protein
MDIPDDALRPSPEFQAFVDRIAAFLTPQRLEEMRLGGEKLSRQLAQRGWPVPMTMQPADAWNAMANQTQTEVDAFFVAHYTCAARQLMRCRLSA